MSTLFTPPVTQIGEADWVNKLQAYLKGYDVNIQGASPAQIAATEKALATILPAEMKEYYRYFGATSNADFMYNLRPVQQLQWLADTDWEFISLYFAPSEINSFIVFSESSGNDPVCFDVQTGGIYLFSHDAVKMARVFDNFSQYLIYQLLDTEELIGDDGLSEPAKQALKNKYLSSENLDYDFRDMKL